MAILRRPREGVLAPRTGRIRAVTAVSDMGVPATELLFCDNRTDGQSTDRGVSVGHVRFAGLASFSARLRDAIWSTHGRQRRVDHPIEVAH